MVLAKEYGTVCSGVYSLVAVFADFFAIRATFAAFLAGAFFAAAFLTAAHVFLVAAIIRLMPSSLMRRFGLAGSSVTGVGGDSGTPLDADHRFRWPSLMRFRAAALIFRRLAFRRSGAGVGSVRLPGHGPEFAYLGVDVELLLFKSKDGGVDDCGSEVVSRHQH